MEAECSSCGVKLPGVTVINKRCGICFHIAYCIMGMADLEHRIIQLWIHRVHFTILFLRLKISIIRSLKKKDHANICKITTVLNSMKESGFE